MATLVGLEPMTSAVTRFTEEKCAVHKWHAASARQNCEMPLRDAEPSVLAVHLLIGRFVERIPNASTV